MPRSRHLGEPDRAGAGIEEDEVGEGPADIAADDPHERAFLKEQQYLQERPPLPPKARVRPRFLQMQGKCRHREIDRQDTGQVYARNSAGSNPFWTHSAQ
jgi:hypothetical protein